MYVFMYVYVLNRCCVMLKNNKPIMLSVVMNSVVMFGVVFLCVMASFKFVQTHPV